MSFFMPCFLALYKKSGFFKTSFFNNAITREIVRNKLYSSAFLKVYIIIIKTDKIVSFKFYCRKGINTGWQKPKLTAVRQK